MIIKVGDNLHDVNEEPVMINFSSVEERVNFSKQLKHMGESKSYCIYPDTPEWTDNNNAKIKEWMGVKEEVKKQPSEESDGNK